MRKNLLKFVIPVTILVIIVAIYTTKSNFTKGTTIDMQGNKDILKVSLNINTGYNNELVIRLVAEGFELPSEIFVDILAKDKSIYTNKLEKKERIILHSLAYTKIVLIQLGT